MAKTYVLDTNVLLHSAKALDSFQDNLVVIPMAVIEELDKFKKNQDELGRNSRQVVRMIDKLRGEGRLSEGVPLHNAAGGKPSGKLMILTGEGEMPEKMDMSIADNRILQVAYMLLKRAKREDSVTLITKDLNLRLRADGLGIPVQDFECQTVKFDELYSGTSETEVDPQTIDDFYKGFAKSLEDAEKNMEGKRVKVEDIPTDEICEKCGRPMVIKSGRYGKFVACSGFPECRNAHPLVKDTGGICPECGGHMLVRKSAKGRIYYGCSNYPKCNFMTWDEPVPEKCPQCGQTLFKKKGQLYCAKEGCGFTKPIEKK